MELGLTQDDVAHAAGLTANSIRRYELGLSAPRGGDRRAYADALRWTTAQLALAFTDDPEPVNGHSVPGWLGHLASLEQAAQQIATFEPVVVHGLLQTAGYACAVEAIGPGTTSDDDIARKVENRMARQAVLDRDRFHLTVILDESVLYRIAGGPVVMADQLEHLAVVADHPAVDLRVLPLDAGVFSAAFGSFTLFTSPDAINPFMVCTEDRAGPHYLDRPHELEVHINLFAHLGEFALSPSASVDKVYGAIKEYR
jgi:hypothetical protein